MMPSPQQDVDVLIPLPKIFRVVDQELRLAPLPIKRLLDVVRYIEKNYDVLEKAKELGNVSAFLEAEVYSRLNGLLRLLFWSQADTLTDEWCTTYLTNAHYRAFIVTALKQNELWELFTKAKGLFDSKVEATLRQTSLEKS